MGQDPTPATRALIAEIESFSEVDQTKDPEGDLVKLADLQQRVEAHAQVPPMERGLLASAFGAAHFYANRYDRAVEYYSEAARLFEEGNAPPDEIAGLFNNQAAILASLARYDEAEASHTARDGSRNRSAICATRSSSSSSSTARTIRSRSCG